VARSGGWFAAGFVSPCPNHICEKGFGIPLNLTNVPLMAVVSISFTSGTTNEKKVHLVSKKRRFEWILTQLKRRSQLC
jgi:hypothetical protein